MEGLFGYLDMAYNHEERCVGTYDKDGVFVDTSLVTDAHKPYETGIEHPLYNDGVMIIVEYYDTKEDAAEGHERWVKLLTSKELPSQIVDVSSCMAMNLIRGLDGEQVYERQ